MTADEVEKSADQVRYGLGCRLSESVKALRKEFQRGPRALLK